MLERSAAVLGKKRASFVESAYTQTKTYRSLVEFSEQMTPEQKPKLFVVGCPAEFRGSDVAGRDLELQLLKLFPRTPLFIEKPISAGEITRAFRVAEAIEGSKVVHSVGFVVHIRRPSSVLRKSQIHAALLEGCPGNEEDYSGQQPDGYGDHCPVCQCL
jgi:hypothetical protein